MSDLINKNVFSFIITIFLGFYSLWSIFVINSYRQQLQLEKQRVYNIAENFEIYKELQKTTNGKLELSLLANDTRNIKITEVTNKEALTELKPGQKLYSMFYDDRNVTRKQHLDKYFSKLVLNNYFYIITSADGKVIEMFWDKP